MSNTVTPDESNHPWWCHRRNCEWSHTSEQLDGRSPHLHTNGRPELAWYVQATDRVDGSLPPYVTTQLFASNDLGVDQVAGLTVDLDTAEQFARDLLQCIAMARAESADDVRAS